ncbi:MAG: hypothetical protein CMM50_15185 [Rhodospirillaceae bacterium]|nr:hypothetical protein [Rhodospirillaceae bacterium]
MSLWLKWLPWRFIVRRIARAQGFLDPIALMGHFHRFAQPSEVAEPIELLRAGAVLHARGLINSRVIQHNLDWVWPYWVTRQFDPGDDAFVPRAFSLTHINLTHRNWTAVGLPDVPDLPVVDPRGLVTPFLDEWSLDGWLVTEDGRAILPSRSKDSVQTEETTDGVAIVTTTEAEGLRLLSRTEMAVANGETVCRTVYEAEADTAGWIIVSLRPYNPEGISFIHDVALAADRSGWTVNGNREVRFGETAARHHVSTYHGGDVFIHLRERTDQREGVCDVGMATAAAMFPVTAGAVHRVTVDVPLGSGAGPAPGGWPAAIDGCAELSVPDRRWQELYDIALRTLVLHSPEDVYPGPYTYKRFWFRDAAFLIDGLIAAGMTERARRAIDRFPKRQTAFGYFHSQDGEWDSNGEALWTMQRYVEVTDTDPPAAWRKAIEQGARWIIRKRVGGDAGAPHAGLLPAGFSAEHLGPNDYYYWDDFWGIAGLRAAAALMRRIGNGVAATEFDKEADDFASAVDRSLAANEARLRRPAIPASPYRRLDAGAVGSLACGYPLQIAEPDDPRLLDTVAFLREACFVGDGFFRDMIHSGINAYLTIHAAQVLLRAGDPDWADLAACVADLASPTGQWPEAIHPRTLGGCMGDGQHVWAAAEWVLMMRSCFVREEKDRLVLAAGIRPEWQRSNVPMRFGPTPTRFGNITVTVKPEGDSVEVAWDARWHGEAPIIEVRLPGHAPALPEVGVSAVRPSREGRR